MHAFVVGGKGKVEDKGVLAVKGMEWSSRSWVCWCWVGDEGMDCSVAR